MPHNQHRGKSAGPPLTKPDQVTDTPWFKDWLVAFREATGASATVVRPSSLSSKGLANSTRRSADRVSVSVTINRREVAALLLKARKPARGGREGGVARSRLNACARLAVCYVDLLDHRHCAWMPPVKIDEPNAVRLAKDFIESHFSEQIGIGQAAKHAGVCAQHLCKVFRVATGSTVAEYLYLVRIERAKQMLADPFIAIKAVMRAVGFRSESHFCRRFSQHAGTTPSGYQANLRQQVAKQRQ